jgi:hypothetical protein
MRSRREAIRGSFIIRRSFAHLDLLIIAAHSWCFAVELFLISIGSVLRLILRWCWILLVDLRGSWGFWAGERVVGGVFVMISRRSAACAAFSVFAEGFSVNCQIVGHLMIEATNVMR